MRLGAAERLGLDYPAVAERNPRIVYAAAPVFARMEPTATARHSTT
jgi:crotonobetainyl-CoA:carnitine CoA-transferase CaiB-like acyl-CoA transferase